ncbi:hypothetical protein JKG68_10800 [Microvirga aerilata]|uniref:Uncharacterized protein n=1 Tax=Microvirga aerilata TaxID=670292 RepID=A0A936ZCA2_9HYPH|nr:hypothetical protein [Microvirga aerilata]MBL0404457.1 hypothetical protein [Microvirga aerilata]
MLADLLESLSISIRTHVRQDEPDTWLIYALAEITHDLPKAIPGLADATSCQEYVEIFLKDFAYWEGWLEREHP